MGDLISRRALCEYALNQKDKSVTPNDIMRFPSAQPERNCSEIPNNWIPCSERLPEEDHQLGGSGKQFSDNVLISIVNRDDEDAWIYVSHTIDGEWALDLSRYCKVLAWMPLPSPYQPEEE